jgi:hypothetical protein
MPYTAQHNYLTIHWKPSEAANETAQFGLRFVGGPAASQSLVNACAGAVSAFWTNATAAVPIFHVLQYLRLATIGTDGLYIPGSVAYDYVYSPTVPGANSGTNARQPLQVANVGSLTTAFPRGRAHRGRVYLPTIGATFTAGPVWDPSTCTGRANAFAAMLAALNGVGIGTLNVMSKLGAGTSHAVTGVAIGNKADVQRRRARSQAESYYIAAV